MDVEALIDGLVDELAAGATPERAAGEKKYLKSDLEFIGATMPAIRKACVRLEREHPELGRPELLLLVQQLWKRQIHELRAAAVDLLDLRGEILESTDIGLIEQLLRERVPS